ncbi:hypothetical protein Q1695_013875 [Nippostrongylus brasiliensis]|nr:hypothetical protein Q1695_013875 [Nippostrongylus brasiliensis]
MAVATTTSTTTNSSGQVVIGLSVVISDCNQPVIADIAGWLRSSGPGEILPQLLPASQSTSSRRIIPGNPVSDENTTPGGYVLVECSATTQPDPTGGSNAASKDLTTPKRQLVRPNPRLFVGAR